MVFQKREVATVANDGSIGHHRMHHSRDGTNWVLLCRMLLRTPTDLPWRVTFSHRASQAPLHTGLHPTQLYSAGLVFSILTILLMFKRHKRFEGELFFVYIILYAIGRGIIEIFRGDEARGYVIDGFISHSQFISLIVISVTLLIYRRFKRRANTNT